MGMGMWVWVGAKNNNVETFCNRRALGISDSLVIMVDVAADTKRDDLSEYLK